MALYTSSCGCDAAGVWKVRWPTGTTAQDGRIIEYIAVYHPDTGRVHASTIRWYDGAYRMELI